MGQIVHEKQFYPDPSLTLNPYPNPNLTLNTIVMQHLPHVLTGNRCTPVQHDGGKFSSHSLIMTCYLPIYLSARKMF